MERIDVKRFKEGMLVSDVVGGDIFRPTALRVITIEVTDYPTLTFYEYERAENDYYYEVVAQMSSSMDTFVQISSFVDSLEKINVVAHSIHHATDGIKKYVNGNA